MHQTAFQLMVQQFSTNACSLPGTKTSPERGWFFLSFYFLPLPLGGGGVGGGGCRPFPSLPLEGKERGRGGTAYLLPLPLGGGGVGGGRGIFYLPSPLLISPLSDISRRGGEKFAVYSSSLSGRGGEKKENSPSDTSWKGRNCHISSPSSGGGGNRWEVDD